MPSTQFTPESIAEQRKIIEAATKGPWVLEKPPKDDDGWSLGVIIAAVARGQCVYAIPDGGVAPEANRRFIAASRTRWPAALQHIAECHAVLKEIAAATKAGDAVKVWNICRSKRIDRLLGGGTEGSDGT